jgi:hypothetical protein
LGLRLTVCGFLSCLTLNIAVAEIGLREKSIYLLPHFPVRRGVITHTRGRSILLSTAVDSINSVIAPWCLPTEVLPSPLPPWSDEACRAVCAKDGHILLWPWENVSVSCGCWNKALQFRWLKTIQAFSFIVLETGILKSIRTVLPVGI